MNLCVLQSALIRQQRCLFETHEVVSEVYQPIRFKATILEFVIEDKSCFIHPMSQTILTHLVIVGQIEIKMFYLKNTWFRPETDE